MVVQGHIAQQGLLHVLATVESMGLEHIGNAAIESLDHAIGSGRPGLGQSVLDAQLPAQLIELMVAAGFAFLAGKQAVRELLAVVGQQLGDPERTGLVQCLQKGVRTGGRLVGLELHEHPACSSVNGHEQVAPLRFALHL